jgi:hypothetical protein
MRKIERIDIFCAELAKIWKENCPDWRFGQLMVNVLNSMPKDPFFPEEDEMVVYLKQFARGLKKPNVAKALESAK